jgi:hypothetical protein
MSKNSYRIYKGPFYNLDSIKREYISIIKLWKKQYYIYF